MTLSKKQLLLVALSAGIGSILGNAADKSFQISPWLWEPAALAAGIGALMAHLLILQFNRSRENGGMG